MAQRAFILVCLCLLLCCAQNEFYDAEFAPEGVESNLPDLDKWALMFPPPSAPSELKLQLSPEMHSAMHGRVWPSILVMGNLDSCSKVLVALHGRAFEFSGPILHIFQHMVSLYNVAVVLPRAPNFDWFDLAQNSREPEDLKWWKESQQFVGGLIRLLQKNVQKPMVVLGFSQSGSLALASALEQRDPVLGVILCSSYVVRHRLSKRALQTSKIVFIHSKNDHVVPFEWGEQSYHAARQIAANVRLVVVKSGGSHAVESDELVAELENLLS